MNPSLCFPAAAAAGESLLEEAVVLAAANGLVGPHDHVVVVSRSSSHEFQVGQLDDCSRVALLGSRVTCFLVRGLAS